MVWKLISTVSLAIDMQIVGSKLFFPTVSCLFSSCLMIFTFYFPRMILIFFKSQIISILRNFILK